MALPVRHRLTGDEIYRRLVKSTVYVRNREGWGSGSLIHKQRKLILTNYHVVGENAEVFVSFPRYDNAGKLIVSGDFYEKAYKRKELIRGKVLKIAKGHDLALVELEKLPEGTPVLKLAAHSVSPGQAVHSVGNPGASDARWSYTSGTVRQVSHKTWRAKSENTIHTFDADVVETQSPTNPGDSGGPLVNDVLQLVGVTQGANVAAHELSLFIDIGEVKKLLQSCGVDLKEVTASGDAAEAGDTDAADLFALIKCLENKDAKVRGEAAHRLASLGSRALPAAPCLDEGSPGRGSSGSAERRRRSGQVGAGGARSGSPSGFHGAERRRRRCSPGGSRSPRQSRQAGVDGVVGPALRSPRFGRAATIQDELTRRAFAGPAWAVRARMPFRNCGSCSRPRSALSASRRCRHCERLAQQLARRPRTWSNF